MNFTNKYLTLTFIVLLLSNILVLTVVPVSVQAVSKPSVPQFTVKFVDYSYDVPSTTTTTTDPFTGEKTTNITPGYHIENKTIEITIKNQPFTPYTDENRITYYLYYNVQAKGYFGGDWQRWGSTVLRKSPWGDYLSLPEYSQGSVVSCPVNYAAGTQVDLRVEAVIGHYVPDNPDNAFPTFYFETDVSSGWSKVQTFTIPDESSSSSSQTVVPSQNPTVSVDNNQPQLPDQTQPPSFVFHQSFLLWIATFLFIGVVVAVVMVFLRRQLKTSYNTEALHDP